MGRQARPPRRPLVAVAFLLTVCSACSSDVGPVNEAAATPRPAPTGSAAANGGILYAFSHEPTGIDPASAVDPDDLLITSQLFDSLTAVDDDLDVVPAAADRWEVNDGGDGRPAGTAWTFHLRPGATFHDGTPVTAASFVAGWERIADRTVSDPSPSHHLLEPIRGIEQARRGGRLSGAQALDEFTLRITLDAPFAELPALLSHAALAPAPRAAFRDVDHWRMPVGNGPFRMAEPWQPDQYIRLERSEEHRVRAALDQVVFRIYEGPEAVETAYGDFLRGNLDLAPVPDDQRQRTVAEVGRSPDGYLGPGLLNGARATTVFYGFDLETAPYDDPAVRRAIAAVIDQAALVEAARSPTRAAARTIVPPVFDGYEPARCAACGPDLERARSLLGERRVAGLELVTDAAPEHRRVAQQVVEAVNGAFGPGTMSLRALAQGEWLEAVRSGRAGFFLGGWTPEYPSPGAYLDPLFHPDRIGSDNLTRHRGAEVTALLERARRALDADERAALYRQAEEQVLADAVVVPLSFYRHARAVSERTNGLRLTPLGGVDLTRVTVDAG